MGVKYEEYIPSGALIAVRTIIPFDKAEDTAVLIYVYPHTEKDTMIIQRREQTAPFSQKHCRNNGEPFRRVSYTATHEETASLLMALEPLRSHPKDMSALGYCGDLLDHVHYEKYTDLVKALCDKEPVTNKPLYKTGRYSVLENLVDNGFKVKMIMHFYHYFHKDMRWDTSENRVPVMALKYGVMKLANAIYDDYGRGAFPHTSTLMGLPAWYSEYKKDLPTKAFLRKLMKEGTEGAV